MCDLHILRLHVPRLLLSLIFLGAGFNGWVVILGYEPVFPTSPKAMELLTGYLLVLEKSVELICGLLLVANRYIPATLAVLAPIVVNILFFHLFVDPSLLPLAVLVFLLEAYLLWLYRDRYKWAASTGGLFLRQGTPVHFAIPLEAWHLSRRKEWGAPSFCEQAPPYLDQLDVCSCRRY